jgi:hypothetical protein
VISLPAQTFPIPGLSQAELSALSRGERLFSVLDSYSDLRIPKGVALAKGLETKAKSVRPNFLAEVIIAVPKDKKQDLLGYMYDSLADVEGSRTSPIIPNAGKSGISSSTR